MTDAPPKPLILPELRKGSRVQLGNFVDRLMACPNIRSAKFKPETALSIDIAHMMRKHTVRGSYNGVWLHVANEGKRSQVNGMILRLMGMLAGAPDYVFLWNGGNNGANPGPGRGMIEIKVKGGKGLTPTQEDFRDWCHSAAVNWALCRTPEQVQETLLSWGALTSPLPGIP